MSSTNPQSKRASLEKAIAIQESLRGTVEDVVIDEAIKTLREKLASFASIPRHQRKLATILFVDIADHTALTVNLDPEEQMSLVDPAITRLAAKIDEYGGHVARYQGDGFKAVFGLPFASEKDPDNAVEAGLSILATAQKIAKEWKTERNIPDFKVRVGIDTGLIFSGGETEAEDTIKGRPVNLAARLESAAAPGTLVISQNTCQHIKGAFDLELLEPIEAKGFSEPVPVYRVLSKKARSFRTRRHGVEGLDIRMIGRERELGFLQEIFTEVLENSERQIVTIVSEAGVGKSRLLHEFENWVDLGPTEVFLYRGRAYSETHRLPYSLLRSIFDFRFEIRDDDSAMVVREKWMAGFCAGIENSSDISQTEMRASILGHLLGIDFSDSPHVAPILQDPQQLQNRSIVYLLDYFRSVAKISPVLLLLDDLHWADNGSLEILSHFCIRLNDAPILLLCATRPGLYERRPHWFEGRKFHQRINLNPLSPLVCRRLVAEVLQRVTDVPQDLEKLIVSHAEGVPFYVEELVKVLVESGVVVTGDTEWRVNHERLAKIEVPSTLTGVLQARLERLPADERVLLQQASVVGRIFWDQALWYLNLQNNANPSEEAMKIYLANLRGKELIYRREQSTFADALEFIFKHAMLREVTYEGVLLRLRREYHGLVAEWLMEQRGERRGEVVGMIADHLDLAGEREEAFRHLKWAGEEAAGKFANDEAVGYYSRALALLPEDCFDTRFELLLAREQILDLQGAREEQSDDLRTLNEIAESLGDTQKKTVVMLRQSYFAEATSDYDMAIETANKAIELAVEIKDQEKEIDGYLAWAHGHIWKGNFDKARGKLKEARENVNVNSFPRSYAGILAMLGVVEQEQGNNQESIDYHEKALKIYQYLEDPKKQAHCLNTLGNAYFGIKDHAKSTQYYESALSLFRQMGNVLGQTLVINNLGVLAANQGNYPLARSYYEQALPLFEQLEHSMGAGSVLINIAEIAGFQEDFKFAKDHFNRALEIAVEINNLILEVYALSGLADCYLHLGDLREAEKKFYQALKIRETMGQTEFIMEIRAGLARVALKNCDLESAKKQIEMILGFFEQGQSVMATNAPFLIYLTCFKVLNALDDVRAEEVLATAYHVLQEQAASIDNEHWQRAFLENFRWHREIVFLYKERFQ